MKKFIFCIIAISSLFASSLLSGCESDEERDQRLIMEEIRKRSR